MPAVVTTCTKCGCQFHWNTDFQEMPDCPNCGHNPKARFRAADLQALTKLLKDRDESVRNKAAVELGDRGDARAVPALIDALRHADAPTRLATVIALGRIGDMRAVVPLQRIAQQGGPGSEAAAEALATLGPPIPADSRKVVSHGNILCPHCQKELLWSPVNAGRVAACPSCRRPFTYPQHVAPPLAPPADDTSAMSEPQFVKCPKCGLASSWTDFSPDHPQGKKITTRCFNCGHVYTPKEIGEGTATTDDNLDDQVLTLLQDGKYIEAIKLRRSGGEGLKDAKDAVDALAARHGVEVPKGNCFIATAACGANSQEVIVLREFRDAMLSTTVFGRAFISAYYCLSPPLAWLVSQHRVVQRCVARYLVRPLANAAQKALANRVAGD